jgi:hypothetical protein
LLARVVNPWPPIGDISQGAMKRSPPVLYTNTNRTQPGGDLYFLGGEMFWILLAKHPVLMTIGLSLPFFAGFIIIKRNKHFTGSEKTAEMYSTRLQEGDEVQVFCDQEDKWSTAFGRVVKSLRGDPKYKHTVIKMRKDGTSYREERDGGENYYRVEFDEVYPPEE